MKAPLHSHGREGQEWLRFSVVSLVVLVVQFIIVDADFRCRFLVIGGPGPANRDLAALPATFHSNGVVADSRCCAWPKPFNIVGKYVTVECDKNVNHFG